MSTCYVYCNRLLYPIPFDWDPIIAAGLLGITVAVILANLQSSQGLEAAVFGLKSGICLAGSAAAALVLIGREEFLHAARRLRGKSAP